MKKYLRNDPILGHTSFKRCHKLVFIAEKVHCRHVSEMTAQELQNTLEEIAHQLSADNLHPDEYDHQFGFLSISWDLPDNWFDRTSTSRKRFIARKECAIKAIIGNSVDFFELDKGDFAA